MAARARLVLLALASIASATPLLKAFADWRILEYQDGRFASDWNPGPPTDVIRLLARKPTS